MNYQFVLFDLDGTLLDTAPDFTWCMNQLLEEYAKPLLHVEHFQPAVATGTATMMQLAFGMDEQHPDYEKIRRRFIDLYHENIANFTKPFDGIPEILAELKQRQIPWGIVTNKNTALTQELLKKIHFDIPPSIVISGDTLPTRKPDPASLLLACKTLGFKPEQGIYVGDTDIDIRAAKAAGMFMLFAEYGYLGKEKNIYDWQADVYIKHPREILEIII